MAIERELSESREGLRAERLLQDAQRLLETHYPTLVSREPTELYFGRIRGGIYARYEGKVRGRHYILLNSEEQPRTAFSEVSTVLHEEVHKKHAEVVGHLAFYGVDLDTLASDQDIADLSTIQLFKKIDKQFGTIDSKITLSDAIKEGLAIYVTLDVLERELETEKIIGKSDRTESLHQEIKIRKKDIYEIGNSRIRSYKVEAHGYAMVHSLVEELSGDKDAMVRFLFSANFERTTQILYGKRAYRHFIKNPLLLPQAS